MALIRGQNCEEIPIVALINIFVKLWNNLVLVYNNGKRIVIKLLRSGLKVISQIFNLNMETYPCKWDIMMWYQVTRYSPVFDSSLVSKLRYTIT